MATIGGSTNNSLWTFKLESYETNVDYTNNYSTVRVDMYIGRASSRSYCGGTFSGSITVDGQVQGFSGTIPYPTYIDGGAWYYTGVTKDFTVYHNGDGNKYIGVSASWGADFSPSSASANGGYNLTYIPRQANITSAPDFNDEQNPTFNYSNPAGNSVSELTAYLEWDSNNHTGITRTLDKNGSSYTYNFTDAERNTLRTGCTGQSRNINFVVYTKIGSNSYWSVVTKRFSIVNGNPVFNDFEYEDTNENVIAVTQNNQILVKNMSTLQVKISSENKMTAIKKATPISYTTTIGNNVVNTNYSSEDLKINVGTVNISGTNQLSVKAIDSRSLDKVVSKNVTVLDYFPVTIQATFKRKEATTGEVNVTYSGNYFNDNIGRTPNNIVIKWYYKEPSDEEWTEGGVLPSNITETGVNNFNGTQTLETLFDYRKQFDFKVVAEDIFSVFESSMNLPKGIPVYWWNDDTFTINGKLFSDNLYPVGSIYLSVNDTNPSELFGGTWERIQDRFLLASGNTYTAGSTGGEASHTLTINEMPTHGHGMDDSGWHTHGQNVSANAGSGGSGVREDYNRDTTGLSSYPQGIATEGAGTHKHNIWNNGGNGSHNNMPPYLTVYMWKRIA